MKEQVEVEKWQLPEHMVQKAKEEIVKNFMKTIDVVGEMFIKQLVEFNKGGRFANAMTDILFKKVLEINEIEDGIE